MEYCTELCIAVATLAALAFAYIKWNYSYWARKSLPHIKPSSFFTVPDAAFRITSGMTFVVREYYEHFKAKGHQHMGFYFLMKPIYLAVTPSLAKNILTKDFQHFLGHGIHFDESIDPLQGHLFNLTGHKWKVMRAKLTPTFTSGKMKMMFPTLVDCGVPLLEHVDKLSSAEKAVDIKETLACFTTDIIGSCAFGLECNSFVNPDAEFRKYGRQIFEPTFKNQLRNLVNFILPQVMSFLKIPVNGPELTKFFTGAFKNIVSFREKNDTKRNDFVQLLMGLKGKPEENIEGLSVEDLAAHAFVFFIAGFETSSTTMTFCLYELASNQEIQQKLRDEIERVLEKHDGKLTYDGIMEMKYMDQVINETLRKHPPLGIMTRECTKDYKVPDSDVTIAKGTQVFISALGFHHDPEFHPNPQQFDPDRFSEANVGKMVPYTFLPFGEGPRICIGLRFGLMQTKVGLSLLLKNYIVTLNKKTKLPLEYDPNALILSVKGDVFLDMRKIQT